MCILVWLVTRMPLALTCRQGVRVVLEESFRSPGVRRPSLPRSELSCVSQSMCVQGGKGVNVGNYVCECVWHYGTMQEQWAQEMAAVSGPGSLSRQLSYLALFLWLKTIAIGLYGPGVTWWGSRKTVGQDQS